MHPREIEALERWIAEYGHPANHENPEEVEPLARRLEVLMRTPDGDDPENWDQLVRSAERVGRRGATSAARMASRTLTSILEGDPRLIEALAPPPAPPPGSGQAPRPMSPRLIALLVVLAVTGITGGVVL